MRHLFRGSRWACVWLLLILAPAAGLAGTSAQSTGKARLAKITFDGLKSLPADALAAESGLKIGDLVGRDDLQAAADRLAQLGLFAGITYEFRSQGEELFLTFHAEEAPRVPAYFDNIPWFSDGELAAAIRKAVPFFDGTCPEGGAVVDRSADALRQLLGLHQLNVAVEHEYIGNPVGEGMIQEFHITGAELKISKVEFGDTLATASRAIQIHVSENVLGKPYSRMMIDLFLSEQVRPVYAQKGYLRARIGPPEIRLSADPTKPLSSSVPVFVPISSGAIFRWRGVEWSGNTALTTDQLNAALGMKTGAVADGTAIQAGFDRTQEEYGRRGYLDAVVHPQPEFDDQAGTVSYRVPITEGVQYRYNDFVITGASLAAEKKIRAAWTVAQGEVFDKIKFEDLLAKLQARKEEIFGDLPVHYDEVGHWLRTDAQKRTVDVLLDFK